MLVFTTASAEAVEEELATAELLGLGGTFLVLVVLAYLYGLSRSPKVAAPPQPFLCGGCGERHVTTARRLKVVRGWSWWFRRRELVVTGCVPCVARLARREALKNLVLGPWSVFSLFLAPLYVLQNVANSVPRADPETLREVLREEHQI